MAYKTPKLPPPLTPEAERALDEIGGHVGNIVIHLEVLSEPALQGVEAGALRTPAADEGEPIWRGVAEAAERRRAILAAHRTGEGEWIAVIDATRPVDPARPVDEMPTVVTAHERCATRDAAVEAGKRLMAEKAEWFGPDTLIEVRIYSALEWREDGG